MQLDVAPRFEAMRDRLRRAKREGPGWTWLPGPEPTAVIVKTHRGSHTYRLNLQSDGSLTCGCHDFQHPDPKRVPGDPCKHCYGCWHRGGVAVINARRQKDV